MAKPLFDSLVRTFVPIIVGLVAALFVTWNIEVDPQFNELLAVSLASFFTFVYYAVARILEVYVKPRFGWLLGLAKAPEYPKVAPK